MACRLAQPVRRHALAARLILQVLEAALGLGESLLRGVEVLPRLVDAACQVLDRALAAGVALHLVELRLQRRHALFRGAPGLAAFRRLVAPAPFVLAELLRRGS